MGIKMTINDVRRSNLRKLVIKYEGMNALARQLGLNRGAYISQLLTENPIRVISEKTARKWEKTLGLAEGWLDSTPAPAPVAPVLDTGLLTEVVKTVVEGLQQTGVNLPPARLADLISMQYADAVAAGKLDIGRLNTILSLLKG